MRFTLIGHACLYVEAGGISILIDPWLSGSCYWRSWWHFPENTEIRPEHLAPDFVYLSHHHFDHFHFPSMRRLDRRARVLIPRFGVDVMRGEVQGLGFRDVVEMDHGAKLDLGAGVQAASFQYGFDDSAIVVAHAGTVIADLNDCKIKGRASKQILRAFGNPTFALKSHSWAQAYPNCYSTEDPAEAAMLGRGDYAESFIATMRELRPRHAIPFASMVGFLHPETARCNRYAVTPPEVAHAFQGAGVDGTTVVVMSPGDSWDSTTGFSISPEDRYADREKTLERLAADRAPQIARATDDERATTVDWEVFSRFFTDFLRSLPIFSRYVFRQTVVFHVPSSPEPYWIVDIRRKTVRRAASNPPDSGTLIRIPEAVLADAIAKKILNFVHISLRISIELSHGGAKTDFPFWGLLTLYEIGYLPSRNVLKPRALRVWWRRRTEILQILASLLGRRSLAEKVIGNLMTTQPAKPS